MAISKEKKQQIVAELVELLQDSKLTAFAQVNGLSVKESQELRKRAKESGAQIRVTKNRLLRVAMGKVDGLKDVDTSALTGQIIYAFADDEVEPAKILAEFAKDTGKLDLLGGFTDQGEFVDQTQAKTLASMPSKDQLRGQLVGTIAAPLSGFVSVLAGTPRGLVNVLNAHKDNLEKA